MPDLSWTCPHCHIDLHCPEHDAGQHLCCPECKGVSCPEEVLTAAALTIMQPLVKLEQRAFRQALREFRIELQDAFEDELTQMLWCFSHLEIASVGNGISAVAEVLCEAVEEELESRVRETGWDMTKRLARRGAHATRAWLKTDEGKSVAAGVSIVAALLGFNLWG